MVRFRRYIAVLLIICMVMEIFPIKLLNEGINAVLAFAEEVTPEQSFEERFESVLNQNGISATIESTDGVTVLTLNDSNAGQVLALLSQQTQTDGSNYQNWNIKFSGTGNVTIPDTFLGLGDSEFPFKGHFVDQSITIITSKTIFKSLAANADLNNVKIEWTGSMASPILTEILVADEEEHTLKISLTKSSSFSPFIGKMTGGTGIITLSELDYSAVKESPLVEYQGDVGLVCGSMGGGTKLKITTLTLPEKVVLTLSGSGSVGGLIGSMEEESELTVFQSLDLNVSLQGETTGGLVGNMTNAVIYFSEDTSISINADITAAKDAGGIIGSVVTVAGPLGENANVILKSIAANGTENSGVLYGTYTASDMVTPLEGINFSSENQRAVSGPGNCGGVFGTLSLNGSGKCSIDLTEDTNPEITTFLTSATNTTSYGGIAGSLIGNAAKNALVLVGGTITTNISVGTETINYPKYVGGIVAKQETATLDAKNSTIAVNDPKTASESDRGFGGVSAYVGDGTLLIVDTITVKTNDYLTNKGGGGVAGSTHKNSVVYLMNTLDLSECVLTSNATSGQIVGSQDCSLIYAPDAEIIRYGKTMELDDIGNYGELYRVENLLTLDDEEYKLSFSHKLSKTNDTYLISDKNDYACFALSWQSRGYFSTVDGIDNTNWGELKSCIITLNNDLNLTGCGIGGLTRDVYSDDDKFEGVLNGNAYTITLDIGAKNSANEVSYSDGRIYQHNATGLFAVLSSKAQVENLTLAGSIRISNNKIDNKTDTKLNMKAAGLAALLSCDAVTDDVVNIINNVSTEVKVDVYANGGRTLYVGGIFGLVNGSEKTILNYTTGTNLKAEITISNSGDGNYNHIGGVIGAIDKNTNITIYFDGATLGGSIKYNNSSTNIYAGGLVGTVFPGGSVERNITLKNLTVDGFYLVGSASDRMGGILGGIWANTDVTLNGLKVNSATLTAGGAAKLGGLVYRASGKWEISSADLSGFTISAQNARALGLLVCQGGPHKEPINGTYFDVDGLYLEMQEYWYWNDDTNKGYNVPENITFGTGSFDEFVVYTAYADRSSNTPDYQITENGGGIISLKTENGTINMTEGERNTYINRTSVGQSKQTNPYSRYYYNLPEVNDACDGGEIDTANELLIWSVCQYAASNLKPYFPINNDNPIIIGGTSTENRASFDMNGLSYYPINMTNVDITVQYADIIFYNENIEEKEDGNKLTRGDSENHSQHYTLHCGLFLNYTANLSNVSNTLTVNGVTFAGTVGVVNGGSGALICGTVKGNSVSGNSSICKVVLADADEPASAVLLNGLSVVPEGDYTPVLINSFGSYTGLKANYVSTTVNQISLAGSSLIGDVGGQGAMGITIEFAGTIKLSENDVFSKAILLNSIRYENGSATYNFYKIKDYDNDNYVHNATHGEELSTTVEYIDKQGCYYDGYGEGYYISAVKNFNEQNDFTSYLPYVAFSPAVSNEHTLANGWHELAVNVLSIDLVDGCGTYGHPYQVDANLLKEAANYINTGTASDGWKVRVSVDEEYHTTEGSHDVELTYTAAEGWKNGEEAYSGDVQQYLANAYYEIKTDIELSDFNGIGTDGSGQGLPFSGVITGKNSDITVTLSGGSTAFIKYCYGSVVRDLNVVLDQVPTINRDAWTRGTAEQTPKTFFGGVIGCILGGDNIIENVIVNCGDDLNITPTGTGIHLVPIGGYVGVIAGGGVIFRGSFSNVIEFAGTDAQLYRNPIIGRVLGGYAFYEGNGLAPDNGDKNYKINKITPSSNDLSWDESTLKVNSAQGLLILSAIVSSGAGSISSIAYAKGKARNAAYDKIGAENKPDDYDTAKKDAGTVWSDSNVPYLLKKYVGYTGSTGLCSNSTEGITIEFAENAVFDMGEYSNGYRGLSARYVSNAAFVTDDNGTKSVEPFTVVMRVKSFNGNGADVQNINMNIKEYADDDFHAASLGGIFNILWTKKQSGSVADSIFAQNLILTNNNVGLIYINNEGNEEIQASRTMFYDEDGLSCVAVGGFIGSVSDIDVPNASGQYNNYLFSNIHINGGILYGPNSAGGLIGATAMTNSSVTGYPGKLLSNSKNALFGPSFLNCSYSNINVTAKLAVGGLAGYVYASGFTTKPMFSQFGVAYNNGSFKCFASCTVTDTDLIVGSDSTLSAESKGCVVGGIFGGAGMRVGVNDPEVDSKTGLNVIGQDSIQTLYLYNITIESPSNDVTVYQSSGAINGPEGSANNSSAGGILGRIGNVNPTVFYDISLNSCRILDNNKIFFQYAGGIVAYGYTNTSITIQRCEINSTSISSKISGGFLGYGYNATGFNLNLSDCKIEESSVYGSTYSGGLVGKASSKYYLFNILIKNTSITGPDKGKGRLFGWMDINAESNNFRVEAAGISVFSDKTDVSIPDLVGNCSNGRTYLGYISYADYMSTETAVAEHKSPYVTVNPNFTLKGLNKLLTGDAIGKLEDDTYSSIAASIWADNKTGATDKKNLASYPKASEIVNTEGKTNPEVSTFHEIQSCGPDDLPVLVIKVSDAGIIEDYLNVITNGGYSEAAEAGVTLTISVYYYDQKTDSFSIATDEQLKNEPASIYIGSDNKTLRVRNSSYDNTRNRFTLIEASFTVKVNGENRTYTVSVPVVVIRELQYNYMTTLTYGTEFLESAFDNLKTHVLESIGNPFTAYLTYQYNREGQEYVEYDWQSYMNDGGSMLNLDKVLSFSSGLPSGTQMILLDCQNGNKAYQYTTDGTNTTAKTDVLLSKFTSVADGTTSFVSSMAEILGVNCIESEAGGYIETDQSEATIRLKNEDGSYTYYRPIASGETNTGQHYNMTVPDLTNIVPEENYYLVIIVPEQEEDFYINGALSSSIKWTMPSSGNWIHRYDGTSSTGSNDESTYQISAGYKQEIVSLAENEAINLNSAGEIMQVKVKDIITFSNQQAYSDADQLLLNISVNLQEYTTGSLGVTEIQFPAGTTGTVHFYIQDEEGKYYTLTDGVWSSVDTESEAACYDWVSRGANMELLLSANGIDALDLSKVRQMIKGQKNSGESKIIVTAEMNIEFSGQEVIDATVPASDNSGADRYAKLHYVGRISIQENALSYSSSRRTAEDNAKYYRAVQYQAILSMDAASINQLGINPLELMPEYLTTVDDKKASYIDLTAALNLSNLQDLDTVLSNTNSLTFTLSLQRRSADGYVDVSNETEYLAFDLSEYDSSSWSWTIPQSQYYAEGKVLKNDLFDGTQLTMPITAYVFTNQKDYANYRIKLTVSFDGVSGVAVNDAEAYVVYTFACIKPNYYDPLGE